jgi:hypothetical protein
MLGYDSMSNPTRVLTIQIVGVYNVVSGKDVYLQFSTDEIDHHGKHSEVVKSTRVHKCVGGQADLKFEKLEFDWYGDEPGLYCLIREYGVMTAYEYQRVSGELFIPRAQVMKYSKMAYQQRNTPNGGAISFTMKPVDWKPPPPPSQKPTMADALLGTSMLTAAHPKPSTVEEELMDLKHENENLRRQLQGLPPLEPMVDPHQDPANFPTVVIKMEVADYDRSKMAHDDHAMYRAASFDAELNQYRTQTGGESAGYSQLQPQGA